MSHKLNKTFFASILFSLFAGTSMYASFNYFSNIDYSSFFTGEHRVRNITLATAGVALIAGCLWHKKDQVLHWLASNNKQQKFRHTRAFVKKNHGNNPKNKENPTQKKCILF